MRKFYITLLSGLLCSIFITGLNAQSVGSYVFLPSSGTYTPLSGTTASTAAGDDGTQGGIPIGFNFTYGGATYTHVALTTNGFMRLGTSASIAINTGSANYDNSNFGASTNQPLIAPLWDDNNASGGSIVYVTSGSAPNRTFSVEWINIHMGDGGSSGAPTGTFQVILSETSNIVKVVYGTLNAFTASTASIGLNDATSFLSVTPGASATASFVTANNNITSSANLTSGTTYSFSPPPPCVPGSLAGGNTQSSVISACASTPFTLSVASASFGTGLTYQWESSLTGLAGSFSPIGGATGVTYVVPGQASPTYYHRKMTCSGSDAFSANLLVGQNLPGDCYCPFALTNNVEPITLVNFNTINNFTSASLNATPASENFTAISTNLSKGQVYNITVKGNTDGGFTTHINVYIDWNQDGDWADAGESYYLGTITNSTGLDAVQVTGSITIPVTALDGSTRMRVTKKFDTQALPCNTTGYGQAEDYTLNISTPVCDAPSGESVGTITSGSAVVSFTSASGTAYVEYGLAGFTPGTGAAAGAGGTIITPAVSPQTIGGLAANSFYDVYIRRDCGGGIFSGNTSPLKFRTLCNAVNTFPYTETFEAADPTRACWKVNEYVAGTIDWIYAAGGNGGFVTSAHSGALNASFFQENYDGNTTKLVSPEFNLSSMSNGALLRFWLAKGIWAGDLDELRVYYKTSAAGPWTLIPGAVYTNGISQWTEVELVLPSSTAAPVYYVAFEGLANFGRGVLIDDVTIEAAPTCPKPTVVTALGITPTTVAVNFTAPTGAYIVEYGAPGFTPGTTNVAGGGTLVFGTGSPIIIGPPANTLTPNTAYDLYVRRICTPGVDFSVNVKATATTLCNAVNVPYLQDFESATIPGIPTCTSVQDVNGNSGSAWVGTGGGSWETFTADELAYVSPSTSLLYYYDLNDLSRGADDWFYTQGLNLVAGTNYRLKFFYKAWDGATYPEKIEVKYGTRAYAADMTTATLFTNNNISSAYGDAFDSVRVDFTPPSTGVYYIGFHAMSDANEFAMSVDDISVKPTPLIDVGVNGITVPSLNCPTNGVFVQATVKNYDIYPINFATYPVTVTANITGTGSATLTALLNTGTLAAGASMSVYLNPAFNFPAGQYDITVKTSTSPASNDPETVNDSYSTSIYVNPSPVVPVITPSSPAICIGTPIQLNTQFTPSPPPATLPAFSSGTITLNIPDNTAAGISNTIPVSGIPTGATITGVNVTINKIAHTYVGDLIINLKAPNNKILNLFNQRGFGGDSLINTVISSAAGLPSLGAGAAPFTASYAPDANPANPPTGFGQTVATFQSLLTGMSGNGDWTLAVRDNANQDAGIWRGWSITITYQVITPTITWTPVTGLYTNATGTTAYTAGSNAYSLYANPAATRTYTVTATTAAGCTASANTTVTVNAYPVVTVGSIPDTVCLSDPLIPLSGSPAGGTWSGAGVSGTNFIPPNTAVGTYTLTYSYTSSLGCTATATKKIAVKDCPERVILLRDNAVLLYPNPSNGQFNIKINSVLYNNLVMKVYNNNGNLVKTQQLAGLAWGRVVPIDLTNMPGGVYMVKFYYDGGVRTAEKTFKVIIGHN